ncbi:MAG: DUF559 domain-containing protein [Thermoguttaceae bacterium]
MSLEHARQLRQNLTDTERFVWSRLRSRRVAGYKFRQQVPLGQYIVDFVCFQPRVVVELDGGQHVEQANYDQRRTAWLESQGFRVLRFWNHEALQEWDTVEEMLWQWLHDNGPA